MSALVVTEPRNVPAVGEQDHVYPLVPGQRLEAVERRGIVWHARRLFRGRPVEPVLVVPRVFVREEVSTIACKHLEVRVVERCYSFCVGYDACNPAAHGGVRRTETCMACGEVRIANVNGAHIEGRDFPAVTGRRFISEQPA